MSSDFGIREFGGRISDFGALPADPLQKFAEIADSLEANVAGR